MAWQPNGSLQTLVRQDRQTDRGREEPSTLCLPFLFTGTTQTDVMMSKMNVRGVSAIYVTVTHRTSN